MLNVGASVLLPRQARNTMLLCALVTCGGCDSSPSPTDPTSNQNIHQVSRGRREVERVFCDSFDRIAENCPPPTPQGIHSRNLREFITLAYCSSRVYDLTHDEKYLEQTQATFQAILKTWDQHPELMEKHHNPFFVLELFFQVEQFLKTHQRLGPDDESIMQRYVDQVNPSLTKEDNQDLAYAVGLSYLMKHYPQHPNYEQWKKSVETTRQRWYSYKHNIENATTYTAIGWNAVFAISRNLNWQQQLASPEIRQIFEQCRNLVTPAGAVANWGDSYFGKSWSYWVLMLDNAAQLYGDAQFGLAAENVFWWGVHNEPMNAAENEEQNFAELVRLKPLADLVGLDALRASRKGTAAEPQPVPQSTVWSRRTAAAMEHADKLVLETGDGQMRHFVMVDLFATGYHAHFNRRGAILHYESNGNPLFHSLDRHNKSLEDAGAFVVMPDKFAETFPSNHRQMTSHWITERIPLRLVANSLPANDSSDAVHLKELVLRFSAKQPNRGILVDDLQLTGPAGVELLDDFENEKQWKGEWEIRTLEDGNRCLAIGGGVGVRFVTTGDWCARTVDLNDFTHVEYDWKDLSPEQRNRLLLRVYPQEHRLEHFDFDARNHHAFPQVVRCVTETRNGNAYATIELKHYTVRNSRLIRQIILLHSGALILAEQFYLPENAHRQLAGPVWNYHTQDLQQHGHWFIDQQPERTWYRSVKQQTQVDPLRTLVWFPPDQGRIRQAERRLHSGSVATVFSQATAEPGSWTRSICVVQPVAVSQNAAELAGTIALQHLGKRHQLMLGDSIIPISWAD